MCQDVFEPQKTQINHLSEGVGVEEALDHVLFLAELPCLRLLLLREPKNHEQYHR